jgi:hypothetical protein
VTLIKAAITGGVRPSTMILGANSRKPWDKWDRLLMAAYQILEGERCPQCGMYRWICANEDGDIRFRLEHDYCGARALVDRENDQNSRRQNYKQPHGETLRPEPYTASGADLSDFREPYYHAEFERREAIEASLRPAA